MKTPIKYGIVGVGGWGTHRRKKLRHAGAFQIVGGVDVRPEAFVEADREEGERIRRFESVEELVADPEIDAVFVCTPAHLHCSQAMLAAQAGKAIFTEKPLGHNLEECRQLVNFCEANNVPHGHGFSLRFSDYSQYVKKMLDEGKLGRVISVSVASMSTAGLVFPPDNWRFRPLENPGGPIFQCGIHKLDLLRFLFGEGKWHAGYVTRTVTKNGTDDGYILLGTFGGIPTTFHSHYVASYRHTLEIYGTHGGLFASEYPMSLKYKATDFAGVPEPTLDIIDLVPELDAETDALRDFAAAIREHRQPIMNGRDGLSAVELIFDAVRISSEITSPVAP